MLCRFFRTTMAHNFPKGTETKVEHCFARHDLHDQNIQKHPISCRIWRLIRPMDHSFPILSHRFPCRSQHGPTRQTTDPETRNMQRSQKPFLLHHRPVVATPSASRSGQPPVKRERGANPRLPPQLLAASVFGTCHWGNPGRPGPREDPQVRRPAATDHPTPARGARA